MNTVFDNSALRSRIISQFGTIKAFSEKVGMSQSCISNRLNNKTELTSTEIRSWANALHLNDDEINSLFFRVCCIG